MQRAALSKLFGKLHNFALCPAAIVSRISAAFSDESTVAAVFSFEISDVPIRKQRLPRLRQNANERIVRGVDHQRGSRDMVDQGGGGSAGIVIVCAGEVAVVSRDAIIKVSQSLNSAQARSVKVRGKQPRLAAKPLEHLQQKIVFVNPVAGLVNRVAASRQIDRRTNRRHPAKLRRTVGSPFAREFQNQIVAHGKANQHEAMNYVALDQGG